MTLAWTYAHIKALHPKKKFIFSKIIFRLLQGYRSGFVYKQPLVRDEPPKPKSDVELPAAVSSLGFLLEEQNLYKDG